MLDLAESFITLVVEVPHPGGPGVRDDEAGRARKEDKPQLFNGMIFWCRNIRPNDICPYNKVAHDWQG